MTTTTMAPVLVIGHKNPDTDAICSAIGYAEYLRLSRGLTTEAVCCGMINARTQWVLSQAQIDPPRLIMDVRPTADSISQHVIVQAKADDSFLDVYRYLIEKNLRCLPVVDENGRVIGMPTVADILKLLVPGAVTQMGDRRVPTSLARLSRVIGATILTGEQLNTEEELVLMVAASSEPTNAQSLEKLPVERVLVVVGDRPDIHRQVIERGVRAVLLTGDFHYEPELLAIAKERHVALLRCAQDTATTVGLIRCSRRVMDIVHQDFVSFGASELVSKIVDFVAHSAQPLFPVVNEESGQLIGVFSKSDLVDPPRSRLILVDHNEFSQAVTGADEAEILEVIDHHRLSGNLVTREPLRFINEPVGSTSTIVARFFKMSDLKPSQSVAVCLAAGLISDTLKLSSPTTTDLDRRMLAWLAEIAQINVNDFTRGFFEAGSILREKNSLEVLNADRKEYDEADWRVSISQIEELGLETFPAREPELHDALAQLRRERALDFVCLLITDITEHRSLLLTEGDQKIIDAIDYPRLRKNVFDLEGVVSRKKQFFPFLSNLLTKVTRS
jgi:manganese-dependent inorganic pyrophosphatase